MQGNFVVTPLGRIVESGYLPLMGRGDDSGTASRVMGGEVAIRNEETEKVSESLQSLLYQQTGFVEYWILNIDFLILATMSKFTLEIKTK